MVPQTNNDISKETRVLNVVTVNVKLLLKYYVYPLVINNLHCKTSESFQTFCFEILINYLAVKSLDLDVPDEGYSRNMCNALNLISTRVYIVSKIFSSFGYVQPID